MQTLISGRGLSCDLPRGSSFPPLIPVRREFESRAVADVAEETRKAMLELNLEDRLRSGDRVLVAAGSRGIKDKAEILSGVCAYLRELDVTPTILGAMGSHGGGTAAGQRDVLESLGITEERVGARIITSDEAVAIGEAEDGQTVYCDPLVFEYDGFLAVNRIKPHTTARGAIQSGIIKMLVVGMGHHRGAEAFHRSDPARLSESLVSMWRVIRDKTPFMGGVGIVDDAQKRAAQVVGLKPAELEAREKELLVTARELMPTLPFDRADVLVIEEMGKNYSGTGIDTNVIGRIRIEGTLSSDPPDIDKLVVLDLTDESHGNACGLGLADFITARLARKVDLHSTYLNVLTSRLTMRAMIPMIMGTDRDAVAAAIVTSGVPDLSRVRLALISNTLHLDSFLVSPALWDEIRRLPGLHADGEQTEMQFDDEGSMNPG